MMKKCWLDGCDNDKEPGKDMFLCSQCYRFGAEFDEKVTEK